MISLRPLTNMDVAEIKGWLPYMGDMEQMDYAVREKGWLDEFHGRSGAFLFAADDSDEVIGFTLLAMSGQSEAEFRIALRADRTGQGLGGEITKKTLRLGFEEYGINRIHLIVRKNNGRAISLYRRMGFADRGECTKMIMGRPVEFWVMDIEKEHFNGMHEYRVKGKHYGTNSAQGFDRDRRTE